MTRHQTIFVCVLMLACFLVGLKLGKPEKRSPVFIPAATQSGEGNCYLYVKGHDGSGVCVKTFDELWSSVAFDCNGVPTSMPQGIDTEEQGR